MTNYTCAHVCVYMYTRGWLWVYVCVCMCLWVCVDVGVRLYACAPSLRYRYACTMLVVRVHLYVSECSLAFLRPPLLT